ncbi:ankyrin repeat-containing protein BDA1 [Quercus suber]|uniref:ankyrin repeat-containing protein BDA1 n=1 Tax=Quercus suber TaxID=58331 RepID=UPI000CE1CF66|nr:ankyrin repeat-containing protein BDA1-like [Quercus suber]
MDERIERLNQVALQGNIDAFYIIIQEDVKLLEHIDELYVTARNKTALHIALKYNKLEAFKFLVGSLRWKWPHWDKILRWKDVEGNTVLHIAVSINQTQAVSHLFAWGAKYFYINCKNLEGKTALDILQEQPQEVDNSEMRAILERAGALRASSLPTVTSSYASYLRLPETGDVIIRIIVQLLNVNVTDERRNALLVVAALLVTVTFQAAITPPGGLKMICSNPIPQMYSEVAQMICTN